VQSAAAVKSAKPAPGGQWKWGRNVPHRETPLQSIVGKCFAPRPPNTADPTRDPPSRPARDETLWHVPRRRKRIDFKPPRVLSDWGAHPAHSHRCCAVTKRGLSPRAGKRERPWPRDSPPCIRPSLTPRLQAQQSSRVVAPSSPRAPCPETRHPCARFLSIPPAGKPRQGPATRNPRAPSAREAAIYERAHTPNNDAPPDHDRELRSRLVCALIT